MGLTAQWEPQRKLWRIVSGPRFTLEDVAALTNGTDWGTARRFLWDLSALVKGPDSTTELRQMAMDTETQSERWPEGRVAVLVVRDYDFGIARMFQAFAENAGMGFHAFRDEADALEWLESEDDANDAGGAAA